jgi:hypothetical protein
MTAVIVIWVLCAIAGALVAENRGRSAPGWAFICLLTGVIGLLILVISPRGQPRPAEAVPARELHDAVCPGCSASLKAPVGTAKCPHCQTYMKVFDPA